MPDSPLPLAGRTALVTGAARGIGRAIASKLAAAGCDVAVNYFNSHAEADALCAEIGSLGRRAVAIQASVAEPASVAEMFETIRANFPSLDFLVSNAASGVLKPLENLTLKHWRWCLETNAFALAELARHAAPLMPSGGRIVALSSLGAVRALPEYAFIGASKAALESLVRSLALELGGRGIRVNAVSAGPVDTTALRAFPHHEEILAEFRRRVPLGAELTAADVADAVCLLCLPEAASINGQTIVVDGGYSVVG